jgi:hypothetical protein
MHTIKPGEGPQWLSAEPEAEDGVVGEGIRSEPESAVWEPVALD